MKHFLPVRAIQRGFTLIELLVVIGILGILAAALIATIDPFEQLIKGTDTTLRSTAVEFVNASTRYYGARNAYPWESAAANGGGCGTQDGVLLVGAITTKTDCVNVLTGFGELKSNFSNNTAILKDIFVSQTGPDATLYACFVPQSKQ